MLKKEDSRHPIVCIANKAEQIILIVLLSAAVILVFMSSAMRWFGAGLIWIDELVMMMSCWFIAISAGFGVKHGVYISFDLIVKRLKGIIAAAIFFVVVAVFVVYSSLMLYSSVLYVLSLYSFGIYMEDIPIQKWVMALCLPWCFLSILLRTIEMTILCVKEGRFAFKQNTDLGHH